MKLKSPSLMMIVSLCIQNVMIMTHNMYFRFNIHPPFLVLKIGFTKVNYSVLEESGFVTLGVRGPVGELVDNFVVTVDVMDLSARGIISLILRCYCVQLLSVSTSFIPAGVDYDFLPVNLTFNRSLVAFGSVLNFNVTIFDDNFVEGTKSFLGQLTPVTMGPNAPIAQLKPQMARIFILDEVDSELFSKILSTGVAIIWKK